ncbi:unnamed protein product, partial [Didymodactylos carnosus]
MGVHIGGPNLYNGFTMPWARGQPYPCQKNDSSSQWIAKKWWSCEYPDHKAQGNYYYLPLINGKLEYLRQKFKDSIHTVLFVIGGFIGAFTGQYWYKYLSRRNAIFINYPFQFVASVLMILTLYIYHGYEPLDPDNDEANKGKKNMHAAIALFFISRFLSGFSAGQCCVTTTSYLYDISPRVLRGTVGAFHQLWIVIGILLSQIIGLPWILGKLKCIVK